MPFYEITEEPTTCWHDDDEPVEQNTWADDIALYLRAEEAWPNGATIREAFQGGECAGFHDDEPGDHGDFSD